MTIERAHDFVTVYSPEEIVAAREARDPVNFIGLSSGVYVAFSAKCMQLLSGLVVMVMLTSGCSVSGGNSSTGDAISWDEALDHVGETQKVCGVFAGSGSHTDDVFINLGVDYPDPDRFTIVLWDVGQIEPISSGSTICTEGVITLYEGGAQIQHDSIKRVEISD